MGGLLILLLPEVMGGEQVPPIFLPFKVVVLGCEERDTGVAAAAWPVLLGLDLAAEARQGLSLDDAGSVRLTSSNKSH